MESPDLNLLAALDALLQDNSVTTAAARLHTSAPAMSRALARLRRAFDDPLLVRAGRDLTPTPRALALRPEIHALIEHARSLFEPSADDDPALVHRTLDLRTSELLVHALAPALVTAARREAPGITLRFAPEPATDDTALRDGRTDLEIGEIDHPAPETHVEALIDLTPVALVRPGHPLLDGPLTPRRFAAAEHVITSRRGRTRGPIDDRLAELGLSRRVVAVVPGFAASAQLARDSDVVALGVGGPDTGPETGAGPAAIPAEDVQSGLHALAIPLPLTSVRVAMAWHPRHDADRAHRWLRTQVRTHLTR